MKASGTRTLRWAAVASSTAMATSMWANGEAMWHTDLEFIYMVTALCTKVNSMMTCRMETVSRLGGMVPSSKVSFLEARSMALAYIDGRMAHGTAGTGMRAKSKGQASIVERISESSS